MKSGAPLEKLSPNKHNGGEGGRGRTCPDNHQRNVAAAMITVEALHLTLPPWAHAFLAIHGFL